MSPAGHAAPAALDAGHRPMGAHPGHSAGCSIALTGEQGVPGSRTPGLRVGSSWPRSEWGCCARRLHLSASILGKGAGHTGMPPCLVPARAHAGREAAAPAALSCSRVASALTVGQEDLGDGVPGSPNCLRRAGRGHSSAPLSQSSGRGLAVGLLGWSWGSRQPLASRNRQRVPTPCWSHQEKHTDGQP